MSKLKSFYLTTTLPYVNAEPHVGFALEIVQADAIARYHALLGEEVFFNTGTDEHGLKILRKAEEAGQTPQEYADFFAAKFRNLKEALNLYPALVFIRTTDAKHKAAAQEFWKICLAKGDIYKKNYQAKYCVGCELEKTDSELEHDRCPIHPNTEIEFIKEENYFFRFSKYQETLLDLYTKNPDLIFPNTRFNEIKAFVSRGLEDFSISRLKQKMPWGIPVPDDPEQVMYVWFDALINYISTIGWPQDMTSFEKWWPVVQFAGKDQVRQQAAMWQAMLLSAGLPASKKIVIHGFITSGGQKMSKSLGNVINPITIVEEYGTDSLRYFLLRHTHPFEDSDFTMERFKEAYNSGLANGLGNLTSRIMTLAEKYLSAPIEIPPAAPFPKEYTGALGNFEFNVALDYVWKRIQELDQRIEKEEPFKLIKKNEEEGKKLIAGMVTELYLLAKLLNPFLSQTSAKIEEAIKVNKKPDTLFPRRD